MQPRNGSKQKSRNVLSRNNILDRSGGETTQRDTVASARKIRNDALKEADEVLKQGVVSDNDSEEMLTVQKSRVSAAMNGLEGNKRKIMTLLESAGQFLDFDEWQEINDDNFDDALKETQSVLNSGSKNLKGMEAAQSLARMGIERFEGFSLSLLDKMFEKIANLREEKSRDAERRAHAAAAEQQKITKLSIQVATLRVERDAECVEKEKVNIERDELIRKLKEKEMAIDELKRNFDQEKKEIELEYKEKLAKKDLEAERLQTVVAELDDELRLRKEDIIESHHQSSSQVQPDFQQKNHFLTVDYERSMEAAESDSSDRGSSSSGEDSLPFIFIPPRAPRIERASRDDWQRPMPVTQKGRRMRSNSYTPLENSGLNRSPSPLKLTKTFYETTQHHHSLPASPFFTVRSIGGNPSASNRPRTVPHRPVSDSHLPRSLPKVRVTINEDSVFLTSPPKLETSRGRPRSTLAARNALNRRASATPSLSIRRKSDFKL